MPDDVPPQRLSGRTLSLLGAVLCGVAAVAIWLYGDSGSADFGYRTFARAAIVFVLVWIAYPSLQRPLRWLPPTVVVFLLIGIGVLVARPRLLPALLPLLGIAATVFGILAWIRKATADE